MIILEMKTLQKSLNQYLSNEIKNHFDTAFCSLERHKNICLYHYDECKKMHQNFSFAMTGKLENSDIIDPQYYRLAFEAHSFAFFRSLHALIESVPYLLNIALCFKLTETESHKIKWSILQVYCKEHGFTEGENLIKKLQEQKTYKDLREIVNISKHRRLPKIDLGFWLSEGEDKASFCSDDLNLSGSHDVNTLMETQFKELLPQVLALINAFANFNSEKVNVVTGV